MRKQHFITQQFDTATKMAKLQIRFASFAFRSSWSISLSSSFLSCLKLVWLFQKLHYTHLIVRQDRRLSRSWPARQRTEAFIILPFILNRFWWRGACKGKHNEESQRKLLQCVVKSQISWKGCTDNLSLNNNV